MDHAQTMEATMSTAEGAVDRMIAQSVQQREIVTVDWAEGLEESLLVRCDDYASLDGWEEYWGKDDDGDDWRVHLTLAGDK